VHHLQAEVVVEGPTAADRYAGWSSKWASASASSSSNGKDLRALASEMPALVVRLGGAVVFRFFFRLLSPSLSSTGIRTVGERGGGSI